MRVLDSSYTDITERKRAEDALRESEARFRHFADGKAHTMLAGQVSAGFKPWGHPENWRDPAKGLNFDAKTFGGPSDAGTAVLMVDGSVRILSKDTDREILRKMGEFERAARGGLR